MAHVLKIVLVQGVLVPGVLLALAMPIRWSR